MPPQRAGTDDRPLRLRLQGPVPALAADKAAAGGTRTQRAKHAPAFHRLATSLPMVPSVIARVTIFPPTIVLLTLVLLITACDVTSNAHDLADSLLDPSPSRIEAPGRRLMAGEFTQIAAVGSELGAYALAFTKDQRTLLSLNIEGSSPCQLDNVAHYQPTAFGNLPYLETELGADQGTLRVVDYECKSVIKPIAHVKFPAARDILDGQFFTLTENNELVFTNLIEPRRVSVASTVTELQTSYGSYWSLEQKQLVLRDSFLEEQLRVGSNVTEFVVTDLLRGIPLAAYHEGSEVLLAGLDQPQFVADNACLAPQQPQDAIALYSPCEERRLQLVTLGDVLRLPPEGERFLFQAGVTRVFAVSQDSAGRNLSAVYITGSETAAHGQLWFQQAGSSPEHWGDRAIIKHRSLYIDHDGETGSLVVLDYSFRDDGSRRIDGMSIVADRVVHVYNNFGIERSLLLANYDGEQGELLSLSFDVHTGFVKSPLADRVPLQPIIRHYDEIDRFALVADLKDAAGTLYDIAPSRDYRRAIAENVLPGSAQFISTPPGIAYLEHTGARHSGKLKLFLFDTELAITIADNVTHYTPTPFWNPGILYLTDNNHHPGIWFAAAR